MVQPRSKEVVIIAAMGRNRVIGDHGRIPWHLPEDFAHFKRSTVDQTLLMGRTTFDSIGRPLPGRTTVVLTRDREWSHDGVLVAHDLQAGLDLAEDGPGQLIVAGGSHIYAEMLPHAQMQVLSEIDAEPSGDAVYPQWDPHEWLPSAPRVHTGFQITHLYRKSIALQELEFDLSDDAAATWWNTDWSARLERAVRDQQARSANPDRVDWRSVHHAAMRVIMEAAEAQLHPVSATKRSKRRLVRLGEHVSMQDVKAIQGALIHWSDYLAPRRSLTATSLPDSRG
jgi:dihydrofolate reductase